MPRSKKKDLDLDSILAEVEGKKAKAKALLVREVGESHPPTALRPWRPMTKGQRKVFHTLCETREDIEAVQEKAKKDLKRVNEKLSQITGIRGKMLETGAVLVDLPYKTQNEIVRTGGAIDNAILFPWAQENEPALIQREDTYKLDVAGLEAMDDVPDEVLASLVRVLKFANKNSLVERAYEESLNLELYQQMKAGKKIPKEILDKAEPTDEHTRFTFRKLPLGKDRCPVCGVHDPKSATRKGPCKTCGHEDGEK